MLAFRKYFLRNPEYSPPISTHYLKKHVRTEDSEMFFCCISLVITFSKEDNSPIFPVSIISHFSSRLEILSISLKVQANPWVPKETGTEHLTTKNQIAHHFSSLFFQGKMYFSQKPAKIKDSQTDDGNSCRLATQFRTYWINRHLETSLSSIFPIHK